jgi:hypothetical protein
MNVLKITVSAGLIAFLLSGVHLGDIADLIAGANWLLLLAALLFYLGAITLGNLKWSILLRAQGISVPFLDLLSYTFAGLFFGNVLPSNIGGDFVRAYDLARHTGYVEQSAISVLIDRLVGLTAFLATAVLMAVLAALTLTNSANLEQIVVAAVIVFAVFLAAFSLLLSGRFMLRVSSLLNRSFLKAFRPTFQKIVGALQVYRHSYRALGVAFLLALLGVLVTAVAQWLISESLGLGISLFYFMLFNPLIAFVLLVPLSVNGIGLKEMAFVFFLGLVGVSQAAALSLSLVFHAIIVLSSLPGGFVWFRERSTPPMKTDEETKSSTPEA